MLSLPFAEPYERSPVDTFGMLLLKGSLMRSVKVESDAENNNAKIEMSNDMVYTNNPLQDMSDSKDTTTNAETHRRVYELEMESADLKTENFHFYRRGFENSMAKLKITKIKVMLICK